MNFRTVLNILVLLLTAGLLGLFNSCGRPGGDSENITIAGNPMSSKMSDRVRAAICSTVVRCHSDVTIDACEAGVNRSIGIGTKLGLLDGAYDLFSVFQSAELERAIITNPIALNPCYRNINELACNDPNVISAYDLGNSDPFANVARLIPTAGSCIDTATKPGAWQWAPITTAQGLAFIPQKLAYYPTPAVLNSTLYFTWVENDSTTSGGQGAYNLRVAAYSGDDLNPSFKIVDGGNLKGLNYNDSETEVFTPVLVTFNNKLYAFWDEGVQAGQNLIRGKVYNGNDAVPVWTSIDTGGLNRDRSKNAGIPQVGILNGKLYVGWAEDNAAGTGQIRVALYNGNDSAPSWAMADGNGPNGLNYDPTKAAEAPTFTTFNSKLYVSWTEATNSASGVTVVHTSVYNGNDATPVWKHLTGAGGLNSSPLNKSRNPKAVPFNGKLYYSWQEWVTGEEIRVAVYNGNDLAPAFTFVDGGDAPNINWKAEDSSQAPQLIVFNSQLVSMWREAESDGHGHVRAKIFNGNDSAPKWSPIDGDAANGLNFDPAADIVYGWIRNPVPVIFNSKIYAIWEEANRIHIKVGVAP